MKWFAAFLAALLALSAGAHAQSANGVVIGSTSSPNISKVSPLTAGQLLVGQGTLSDPLAKTIGGDCTLSGAGNITCLNTNGVSFGTAATVNTGTSGAAIPILNAANTFGTALTTFTGHVAVAATPPTLSTCGTSPAIVGDDKAGQVTMGTGSPTGCVITFATAYTAAPLCAVTWQATPLASQSYTVSNTAITLSQTGTSSNKVNYYCAAQNGG